MKLTPERLEELKTMAQNPYRSCANQVVLNLIADLEEAQALIEPYRKDAERLDLLGKLCKETPLRPNAFCSEIAPDTRLRYDFPTLVSYDSVGNQISLRDAIDAAIAAKGDSE